MYSSQRVLRGVYTPHLLHEMIYWPGIGMCKDKSLKRYRKGHNLDHHLISTFHQCFLENTFVNLVYLFLFSIHRRMRLITNNIIKL